MELRFNHSAKSECGTDEAGRGCLAGPVVAAAVILPDGYSHPKLRDSKKMTKRAREEAYDHIVEHAVAYGVAQASPERIDRVNILQASLDAMHAAIDALAARPDFIIVDGNQFRPYATSNTTYEPMRDAATGMLYTLPLEGWQVVPHECIVKGDDKYLPIAAASVLAKVSRDRLMEKLAEKYPGYGWETNAGYGTKAHIEAIKNMGPTPWHRRSFLSGIIGGTELF